MPVPRRHDMYGVEIAANKLGGITAMNIGSGADAIGEPSSGGIYPKIVSQKSQKPTVSFTTKDIDNGLTWVPITGVNLASSALTCYAYLHAIGGGRASGALHRKYVASNGILVPSTINVSHQEDAELVVTGLLTSDPTGANDPVVITDTVVVPTGFATEARWTIGTVAIAGVTLQSVRSISIEYGIQVIGESADSDIWDTKCSIVSAVPVITIRGIDLEWLKAANIPLEGAAGLQADTKIFLKKREVAGSFEANGNAVHILLQAAGYAAIEDIMSASPGGPSECSVVFTVYDDDTNDPIKATTDIAIT